VILRPDGTTASDSSGTLGNTDFFRDASYWFSRNAFLATPGTWTTDLYLNGTRVASAPFLVVTTAAEEINHAPLAVASVVLDPPSPSSGDVPFCRVTPASLYRRDPDYDLVRYRFRWEINGALIREVTNAGLADAIPRGVLRDSDRLTCTVTPFDESIAGPSASVSNAANPVPGPPAALMASSKGNTVTLAWAAPSGGGAPDTYIIEAGSSPGAANLASFSTGTTATTFSASGVGAGTYYVRVRAQNAAGSSAASNEAILVVGAAACSTAPGAPGGLTSRVSGSTVTLSWSAPSGGCAPTSYVLQAGSAAGLSNLANAGTGNTATTYVATGVGSGTYYVRVRALNANGQGAASNEIVIVVG
jgi:fibronectin type III domain protein